MPRLKNLLSHDRFFQIFLVFFVVQLLVKIAVIVSFDDRGFEPDSYQHFLQVRTVLQDFPHNLWTGLDVWAKPLYVYPFALLVTLTGVDKLIVIQLANAFISSATIAVTFAIARKLFSSQIALVTSILLASSLLFFKSSVSDLTEPIFALFLALALYSVVTERFKSATLLFSIAVLGRIEGLFFLGIYGFWLVITSYKVANMKLPKLILEHTLIATLPLAIWVVAGYSHYHDLSFLPGGYVSATDVYGQGHLFFYPYKFLTQELVISVLFAFSAILLLMLLFKAATGSPIKSGMTKKTKFNILILIFSAGFIATQIITWSTGTLGSAGLMRYFVGIMPMMALFSGLALTWFSERLQSKSQYAFTLLASLLIIVSAVLTGLYATGKLDNGQPWLYDTSDYKLAGTWIADNLDAKTTVYYDRPETIYYSSRDLTNTFTTTPTVLNESGAVIVWTQSWGVSVGGLNEAELVERAQQLASFDEVVIYQVY